MSDTTDKLVYAGHIQKTVQGVRDLVGFGDSEKSMNTVYFPTEYPKSDRNYFNWVSCWLSTFTFVAEMFPLEGIWLLHASQALVLLVLRILCRGLWVAKAICKWENLLTVWATFDNSRTAFYWIVSQCCWIAAFNSSTAENTVELILWERLETSSSSPLWSWITLIFPGALW